MKTVRELREERYWTQLELAGMVKVNPSTIANWEHGRTRPRPPQIRALAEAFGIQPAEIRLLDPADTESATRA